MKNKSFLIIKKQPQLVILAAVFLVFTFAIPKFATAGNLMNVLKTASVMAFACIGLSVVLIGGNLDLSIGSQLSCLCVISMTMQRVSPVLGILVPVAVSVGFGVMNGVLVYRFKINSIVVTLGTMSVLEGLALLPSNAMSVQGLPGTWFSNIAGIMLGPMPVYVIYFTVLAAGMQFILTKSKFGRGLYYLGSNPEAARTAGHDVGRTTTLSFVICSLCISLSAIVQSSRMMTANPVGGTGLEFEALTALLIGGISLTGGRGNIVQAVTGVLLLTLIVNGMNLVGAAYEYQLMAKGILIIVAIVADAVVRYRDGK